MNVELLYHTPDPERAVATAARLCYAPVGASELMETLSEEKIRKVANKIEDERSKAVAYHDTVAPKMEEIRYQIDKLELVVSDELWTLPKYREMLFLR